ncbi:MAG: molybdopterin-guanine dinucleotide biosynthesis protein B [Aquisalimonadaceae bacterium]
MSEQTRAGWPAAPDGYRELWPKTAIKPILGLAGWSGSGKTTLLAGIIPLLVQQGVRIALIKHAHHRFDVDHPGKDSHILRKAGASQVLLTSGRRFALMHEREQERDPVLVEELSRLDQSCVDLVLVEGFRDERFPKLEVHRPAQGRPALHDGDDSIIAVATDAADALVTALPILDLNNPPEITGFIARQLLGRH